MMEERNASRNYLPPLVMLAFLFAGIMCGYIYGNITAGTLIGLGTGIIMMVVLRFVISARRKKNFFREHDGK